MRDVCIITAQKLYPGFTPQNDFELEILGGSPLMDHEAPSISKWLEDELGIALEESHTLEKVLENSRRLLDMPVDPTGVRLLYFPSVSPILSTLQLKPKSNDEPGVYVRAIPDSAYSIRLFPGCRSEGEYCLDFVCTATGEPVNSPFKYELWSAPNRLTPWTFCGPGRLRTLDAVFGIPAHEVPPGEEKYLVKDGQTYVLKRPKQKGFRFTVPVRVSPVSTSEAYVDADLPQQTIM